MKSYKILFFLLILCGCETHVNQTEKKNLDTYISKSVDTLAQLIDLTSYRPKSVSWTVKKLGIASERIPGPTDYKLQVLMTFDDTTITRLKTTYKLKSISYEPRSVKYFKFDWLPQEYTFSKDSTLDVTYRSDGTSGQAGVPQNGYGYAYPHSGNGYGGIANDSYSPTSPPTYFEE